jgi:prepilin-type processing-associated H-X9-DG protein
MRRAFTRIEVVVLLTILAMALGIFVCAVQQVRLLGARNNCTNCLRNIGYGLQQYHDTHKKFPPGYTSESDAKGNDTGPGWGWAAHILPHMELINLHREIKFTRPIEEAEPYFFSNHNVKSFRCSPDELPLPRHVSVGPRDASGQLRSTIRVVHSATYVGNYGDSEPGPNPGTGVFYRNSAVKLGDITDGAGSTLMVGERSFKYGDATWVGAVTGSHLSAAPDSGLPTTPKHAASYVLGHTGGATEGLRRPLQADHFSSAHPRGANFLFADGSVRFLSSSVDSNTLKALSTRAGGEKELGEY